MTHGRSQLSLCSLYRRSALMETIFSISSQQLASSASSLEGSLDRKSLVIRRSHIISKSSLPGNQNQKNLNIVLLGFIILISLLCRCLSMIWQMNPTYGKAILKQTLLFAGISIELSCYVAHHDIYLPWQSAFLVNFLKLFSRLLKRVADGGKLWQNLRQPEDLRKNNKNSGLPEINGFTHHHLSLQPACCAA